jgi:hypothetical protein
MAFASHRYLKSLDDAKAHVRYIGFREREEKSESLGLFSEHTDNADTENFIDSLKDKRLSHPDVPTVHTVLFSMSGDEWNKSGFEAGDYQKMIRKIMKDFEIQKGYRLNWVAAEHRNPDHPHCHVVIKGSYTDKDGIEHRLKISNEDRKFFREQFQQTKEVTRPYDPPPRGYEMKPSNSPIDLGTDFVKQLMYEINRDLEQEEWEREQARKKKSHERSM